MSYYGGSMSGWELKNPIPDMVKDKGELVKLFQQGQFLVPYSRTERGKSAHSTLKMLYELAQLSSILKSVLNTKTNMCFSGGIDKETSGDILAKLEGIGIFEDDILAIAGSSLRDESICGTVFLKLSVTEVEGKYMAKVSRISPKNALPAYDHDRKNSDFNNLIFYSDKPIGNDMSMEASKIQKEWNACALWPKVTKRGKVSETMFQLNAVGYEDEFWGRPVVDPNWMLTDYQTANTVAKVAGSEVTAKVMMLMREPSVEFVEQSNMPREDLKRAIAKSLRDTMTNRGDGSESLGVVFHASEEPPVVETVNINRDSQYLEVVRKQCVNSICSAYGIPANLAGLEDIRVGLGGDVVLHTLLLCNAKTIDPTQRRYERFLNQVYGAACQMTGMEQSKFTFSNYISTVIDQFKDIKQVTSNGNRTADTDPTGGGS